MIRFQLLSIINFDIFSLTLSFWFYLQLGGVLCEKLFSLVTFVSFTVFQNLSLGYFPISNIFTPNKLLKLRFFENFLAIIIGKTDSPFDPSFGSEKLQQFNKD